MHLTQSWSKRNITPNGRITVLKSLILSKITHILISLPAPDEEMFKKLEKMCVDFIWKGGRHEVSKDTLYKTIKQGGLNMINIREFEMALKFTWIRKLIKGDPDWSEFADNYHIKRLCQTDENYHKELLKKKKKTLLGQCCSGLYIMAQKLKLCTERSASHLHLWGNPEINVPFNVKIYNGNIRYAIDLYKNGNERLTQEEIEVRIGTQITFIDYHALYTSIPKYIRNDLSNLSNNYNVNIPTAIQWLIKDQKSTKCIWEIFLKSSTSMPIGQVKWTRELSLPNTEDWETLYLRATKCNLNARIKYFNYKILQHTLITNKDLYRFGIAPS